MANKMNKDDINNTNGSAHKPASTRLKHFEADDKILPLNEWPACLIDLATSESINCNTLLTGTGIFYDDLLCDGISDITDAPQKLISCDQFKRLQHNFLKSYKYTTQKTEAALRYGRRLPYASKTPLLQALSNAHSVEQLLRLLKRYCRLYFPLLHCHLVEDHQYHYLIIDKSCDREDDSNFLALAFISSITAFIKMVFIEHHRIAYYVTNNSDATIQLETYLGSHCHAQSPINAMAFPNDLCEQRLQDASQLVKQRALTHCRYLLNNIDKRYGFIERLQYLLVSLIHKKQANLIDCANTLQMSTTSLKRKLSKHGTSFQNELDNSRKLLALRALYVDQQTNEQTAERVGINDTTNFRRSFKRWTGLLPSHIKRLA